MKITTWQKNLAIFFLITLAIIGINTSHIIAAMHHHYYVYEQDAYMHLVITTDILKTHDWYQHFMPRVNAPIGANMHSWTQVINAILVSGTLLFKSFMPASSALYWWSFIVPMLANAIAAAGMLWATTLFKPDMYQQIFIVTAFLFNPFINAFFSPLMVNYDFLLITLGIFYWGYLLRLVATNNIKWILPVAITASLGIWTSISFIIIVFTGLAFLAWFALIQSQMRITIVTALLAAMCITLALVVRLEHLNYFTKTHDIVSIVHLLFFILLLLGSVLYSACLQSSKKPLKIIMLLLILSIIFLIMNALFPGFYKGPYNNVSPWLLTHFFPVVSKFHSPFRIDNSLALALLCYFFIGMGYFYYLYISNSRSDPQISLLLWATTITTALTVFMYRWSEFSVPLSILTVSFFVAQCGKKITGSGAKWLALIIMILLPTLIFSLARPYLAATHLQCQQQFYNLIEDGFLERPQFNHDKILFIHSNYGPLMLYKTHYSVIATNDHHNPDGVKDNFEFFKANEPQAREIVTQRNVDLILLCQAEFPTRFDPDKSPWLQAIPLPDKYKLWRLYQPQKGQHP